MKIILYLGCTVPVRNLNYEISTRKILSILDIEIIDLPKIGCCGYPFRGVSDKLALVIGAQCLAQIGATGLDVVTLCSSCANMLSKLAYKLDQDIDLRNKIQVKLTSLGLIYKPGIRIFNLIDYLLEEVTIKRLQKKIIRPLNNFIFALHYGCHYFSLNFFKKKISATQIFINLSHLIEITGAESLDYKNFRTCCGGSILRENEELAESLAGKKLDELNSNNITAMVINCPFCNVMFENKQKAIAKRLDKNIKVPVIYLTQLLGLAMGVSYNDLGFKFNRIKPKNFLLN